MSRRKFVTERDIRRNIIREGSSLVFRMSINKVRVHESQGTLDMEEAFQRVKRTYFPNSVFQDPSDTLLSQLFPIVQKAKADRSPRYLRDMKTALDMFQHIVGDKELGKYKEADVVAFRTALLQHKKRGGKNITGHRIMGIMLMCQSAFHLAARMNLIPKNGNPFRDFEPVDRINPPVITFTKKEYHAYRDKAIEIFGLDFALQLDLYLLTGMRDSEWCAVDWSWIDWRKKLLIIPGEFTKKGKPRKIPLTKRLIANLRTLETNGHISPVDITYDEISHRWSYLRTGRRTNRRTFTGTGIPGTFHDLRKTTRTELVVIGLQPDLLNGLMGHVPKNVGEEFYLNFDRGLPVVRRALERLAKKYGL